MPTTHNMVQEIEGFYVDDFRCEENMMHYWWERLSSLDVQTPKTYIFEIEDGEPDFAEIRDVMVDEDWSTAFIRSDNFSDKINPKLGSQIWEPEIDEVWRTYEALKNHHLNHMGIPMGDIVAVREWLDLLYCPQQFCGNYHPTEIRFIIEGRELDYVIPSTEYLTIMNRGHDCIYDSVDEMLSEIEPPLEELEVIMDEFSEYAWHVDACLTSDGEWYWTDMGLNGVYWNGEEYFPMCGQANEVEEMMKKRANEVLEIPNGE